MRSDLVDTTTTALHLALLRVKSSSFRSVCRRHVITPCFMSRDELRRILIGTGYCNGGR